MRMKIEGQVDKINGKELSYSEFAERYMAKNKPVVLTHLMDDWRACLDWVTDYGKPNLLFFSSYFGKSLVQVADCDTREFTEQKRVEMSVSEFIDHWIRNSEQCSGESLNEGECDKSVLYLKDWHFVKEYPDYVAYKTPPFFCDDWLNMYFDNYRMHEDPDVNSQSDDIRCSDYRFVYMGEKGSWTPLHADVFMSYSWSANVCGRKRWLLLSPSQKHCIFDRNMKNCVYDMFDEVSETKFPCFKEAVWLECIQEPNEVIFVPSGWYHQVHNLEDTISINHNWFNRHNLSWVWGLLLNDYDEAKGCIEDIKDISGDDFEDLCQRNLAANTGMNFYDFFIFLARICLANAIQVPHLPNASPNIFYDLSTLSNHLNLNLAFIQNVAIQMKSMNGLTRNHAFYLDIWETLDDTRFIKLHKVLEQTCGLILCSKEPCHYASQEPSFSESQVLDVLRAHGCSRVSTPQDLLQFINNVLLSTCNERIQ